MVIQLGNREFDNEFDVGFFLDVSMSSMRFLESLFTFNNLFSSRHLNVQLTFYRLHSNTQGETINYFLSKQVFLHKLLKGLLNSFTKQG